jgi:hypothetical protein
MAYIFVRGKILVSEDEFFHALSPERRRTVACPPASSVRIALGRQSPEGFYLIENAKVLWSEKDANGAPPWKIAAVIKISPSNRHRGSSDIYMEAVRDYTIRNGLGVRVWNRTNCRVIRLVRKEWVEIGERYALPIDRQLLVWTETGIPASILAVAVKVYELDHPESGLRWILTSRRPVRRTQPQEAQLASSL